MRDKIRIGLLGVILCLSLFCNEKSVSYAEENTTSLFTEIDEDGNIYTVEPDVGTVENVENQEENAEYLFDSSSDIEIESREYIDILNDDELIVNFNTKGNAITNYVEVDTGIPGYLNGAYTGDAAYLGLENGKVKFMLSGVIGLVPENEVQIVKRSAIKSMSHYVVKDGWLIHKITYNLNRDGYAGSLKVGKNPGYLSEGTTYYSYDGHFFYTDYHVMIADYKVNNRSNAVNTNTPYFNYFQYLPLRSPTLYSESQIDSIIQQRVSDTSKLIGTANIFIQSQNLYGVNALLTLSLAANESAWGSSWIAQNKNNLFGLRAVDSSPGESADSFRDTTHCITEFMREWMSKGYLYPNDRRYYGGFLGNKGSGINVKYASDPYWGEKAASIAWNLDESLGQKDQYSFTIGVKDIPAHSHNNINIYLESNVSSKVIYTSGLQSATTYLIINNIPENGMYRVQSDGIIKNGELGYDTTGGRYNFGKMQSSISADSITIVNRGDTEIVVGVDAFADVNEEAWYYESVKYMYERGIMSGMNSKEFGVMQTLARAHCVTTIYRMSGGPNVSFEPVFPDVVQGQFYTLPAIWAYNNNIMKGYEIDGRFGGTDNITREQMATILFRYANSNKKDTSARGNLSRFPDGKYVQPFAVEAMQWAVGIELIKGDDGNLNPQGSLKREECAEMLTRYMKKFDL